MERLGSFQYPPQTYCLCHCEQLMKNYWSEHITFIELFRSEHIMPTSYHTTVGLYGCLMLPSQYITEHQSLVGKIFYCFIRDIVLNIFAVNMSLGGDVCIVVHNGMMTSPRPPTLPCFHYDKKA